VQARQISSRVRKVTLLIQVRKCNSLTHFVKFTMQYKNICMHVFLKYKPWEEYSKMSGIYTEHILGF